MAKELPAIVRAQVAIIARKPHDFQNRNMTKVPPATARAQIPILIRKSVDLAIGDSYNSSHK